MTQHNEALTVEIKRQGNSLGLASLILGILAFTICWIPLLGMLGIPLSALGLVLGGIGFLVALARKGASIGFPIAGLMVSGIALVVAWTMTSVILNGLSGASEGLASAQHEQNATNQVVVVDEELFKSEPTEAGNDKPVSDAPARTAAPVPGVEESGLGATTPEVPTTPLWAPAEYPVRQGDVQVRIVAAQIGKIEVEDNFSPSDEPSYSIDDFLAITIEISNYSTTKKIEYTTWAGMGMSLGREYTALIDEYDNRYKHIYFGFGNSPAGRQLAASIRPGKLITDVLVFELPVDAAELLRLTLPASNFGGTGMLRIEIPASMVQPIEHP